MKSDVNLSPPGHYGRLLTRADGAGTYTYIDYDINDRAHTVEGPWGGTVTYTYDALGRVHATQVGSGEATTYNYDLLGRLTSVSVGTRAFTDSYTGADTVPARLDRPGGNHTDYTYDNLSRLKDITSKTPGGAVISANAFTYNKAHMRTVETVTNGAAMSLPVGSIAYGTANSVNQLPDCTYDNDGNMTGWWANFVAYTAEYDAENRLASVLSDDQRLGSHSYAFTYNADGALAKQVVDGVETRFVLDGFNVLEERNASNAVTRSFAWDPTAPGGIGGLLEMTQDGKHYNYYYDGKGNVSAVINADPDLSQTAGEFVYYRNDSFGVLRVKSGTLEQPYMFSTKRYYESLAVSYFGYRWENLLLGRWLTHDPAGESADVNLYRAMGNSIINRIDPLGLKQFEMTIWTGGTVGYFIFGGGAYNVTITDQTTYRSTVYTMKVFGIGFGLPSFRANSRPVKFNTDDCRKSDSFDGNGYIAGASVEVIVGLKVGGSFKIPNGPTIVSDFFDWHRGGFDVSASANITYWSH